MARTFHIRLAGLVIEVTTLYDETYELCRDYLCEEEVTGGSPGVVAGGSSDATSSTCRPAIVVATNQADIDYERAQDRLGDFADSYYETLAVYRQIAEQLPLHDRLLVHGSAVAVGGRAWMFMAPSGTGKSTHSRWWRAEFADEHPYMVNDDKPIVGLEADAVVVYGTPWDGKEHLSTNTRVPLAALGLLERGEDDQVEPLAAARAIPQLLPFVYRPHDREAACATLSLIQCLLARVPLYRVSVTNAPASAHVTRSAMECAVV